MKTTIFTICLVSTLLISLGTASAQEKQLVPFKIVGTYQNSHILLVPSSTSAEQLTDLITAIACHRRAGNLKDIGIPPATPRGKMGPYAIINIFFFNNPSWASVDKLARWFKLEKGDTFDAKFGQHIKAYYFYSILYPAEVASLGYADSGRPYSRDYKPLTPVNLAQCKSTKYVVANLLITDELQAFMNSKFAKQFELQKGSTWALRSGGQNIEIVSKKLPPAEISLEQNQKALTRFWLAFRIGYSMGKPEWDFIKGFIEQILPQDSWSKALTFVKQNINNPIKEKKDPSYTDTVAMSSYPTQQLKGFTIRAGKHGDDPTLIIEKEIKF